MAHLEGEDEEVADSVEVDEVEEVSAGADVEGEDLQAQPSNWTPRCMLQPEQRHEDRYNAGRTDAEEIDALGGGGCGGGGLGGGGLGGGGPAHAVYTCRCKRVAVSARQS